MKKIVVMFYLLFGIAANAQAFVILDQSFTEGNDTSYSVSGKAQTFLVGKDGLLDHINLGLLTTSSNTSFYVLPTLSGVPSADFTQSLATVDLSNLHFFNETWVTVDLSSFNIPVTTGDTLSMALIGNVTWGGDLLDSTGYPEGKAYEGNFDVNSGKLFWNDFGGERDYHFQTFVDDRSTTVTPEPSTMLLLGGGLMGALWRRRKISGAKRS